MSLFRLITNSLAYHWRIHAAVALGVMAAAAVLTGALLVGDSLRGSLRDLTLDRLGRIDDALVSDHLFREKLADEWSAQPELGGSIDTVPAILLRVSLEGTSGESPARANHVNLIGCESRFWKLGSGGPSALPDAREIVLNEPLADQLGVRAGDEVLLRLPRIGVIPAENPLGRRTETVETQRVTIREVIPAQGLGRFTLRPNQQTPRNAYVPLDWLQQRLDQPGRVNTIFVANPREQHDEKTIAEALRPTLDDYGIRVDQPAQGYLRVATDRMIFEPAVEQAVRTSLKGRTVQPALTYLANTIASGTREIPYSTVAALDFTKDPPLGPMLSVKGEPVAPLADGEIALNSWAADDLQAKPSDTIRLRYFEPESTQGEVRERMVELKLAAIVQLAGAAADPAFTPEVPGLTDKRSIAGWDPPFPFDASRVRRKDEQYWDRHRGTPKAFVSSATGQRLWASRFGRVTTFRVAPEEGFGVEQLRQQLRFNPAEMGFAVQPVKRQGLEASKGTTPFEGLFLGFSFFIIASAVMLVAILFRLGIDRRAAEMGILIAVGLRQRQVAAVLAGEGLIVAAVGSLLGAVVGIGYAALMLAGLQTWWLDAVVTPFLTLHVTWTSLVIGLISGLVVALIAILGAARRAARGSPRQLLAGETTGSVAASASAGKRQEKWLARLPAAIRNRLATVTAGVMLVAAVALGMVGSGLRQEAQAGLFFGAGALVLAASLAWMWSRLVRGAVGAAVAVGRGNLFRLAARSAARHPVRSVLTIGLVAAASFLIVAVSAFRLQSGQNATDRRGGTGGFTLVGESDQPIYQDLNSPEGRSQLGFTTDESQALAATRISPLRVKPGDDASCLNLYQARQPRVLGVPSDFIQRDGFAWAGHRPLVSPPDGDQSPSPWRLLEIDLGCDPDGVPRVPVVLEKNTATYALHLGGVGETYELADGRGGTVRLEIVGLLDGSIFQGDLLVSETAFLRHFPGQTGYRFFLMETPPEREAEVQKVLERALGDFGFVTETAARRLAAFQAVQNTYLSTFQSLGGLGLLLGTFGLAAVQLRSVLERRRELALMRAMGFRRRTLGGLVTLESSLLLITGLAYGILAALVAVLPHLLLGGATIPWVSLAGTLFIVLAVGLAASLIAVRAALATPLLASLRGD